MPEPQPDHAQRISKFAGDCMIKMKELVAVLEEELGEGTSKLSFRVGLNSGGVTVSSLVCSFRASRILFTSKDSTRLRLCSVFVRGATRLVC